MATTTLLSSPQSPCFDDTSLTERTRTNDQKTGFIKLSVFCTFARGYFFTFVFLHSVLFVLKTPTPDLNEDKSRVGQGQVGV